MLLEYQEGGSLSQYISNKESLDEHTSRIVIEQLLLTVHFMTNVGVIHRDLKPENILMNSKVDGNCDIRIADFGLALTETEEQDPEQKKNKKLVFGTPGYLSPESLAGKGYSLKTDIFSLGSMLFSMLTGKNLFDGNSYQDVILFNLECNLDHVDRMLAGKDPLVKDLVK